jgi:hypothetical protein
MSAGHLFNLIIVSFLAGYGSRALASDLKVPKIQGWLLFLGGMICVAFLASN